MKLAVIIVNYHNQEETVACVDSLRCQKLNRGQEIGFFVIDNASNNYSLTYLNQNLPNATIIPSKVNLGFAGGSNLGLNAAIKMRFDTFLLLNPDTIIKQPDFLQHILSTKGDIIAPVLQYTREGSSLYDFGGQVDYLFGRNTHIVVKNRQKPNQKPDYFTGACLLIHQNVIKKIGYLDDQYFLYYEDADYCLRAQKAGLKIALAQKAQITHFLSTTTSKLGKKKISILAKSHWRFCTRHLPPSSFPLYLVYNLYLNIKSLLP